MPRPQNSLAFTMLSTLFFVTFVSAIVHHEHTPHRSQQARQFDFSSFTGLNTPETALESQLGPTSPPPEPPPTSPPPELPPTSPPPELPPTSPPPEPPPTSPPPELPPTSPPPEPPPTSPPPEPPPTSSPPPQPPTGTLTYFGYNTSYPHTMAYNFTPSVDGTGCVTNATAEPLATEGGCGHGFMEKKGATSGIFAILALLVVLPICVAVFFFLRKRRSRMLEGSRSEKEYLRPNRTLSVTSLSSSTSQPTIGSATGSSLTGTMDIGSFSGSAYAPSHYGDGQDRRLSRFSASSVQQSVISPMIPATTTNSVLGAGYTNGGVYYSRGRTYDIPRSSAYAKYKSTYQSLDVEKPPLVLDQDPFMKIPTPLSDSSHTSS